MSDLASLIDNRNFVKDEALSGKYLQDAYSNDFLLAAIIRAMHASDGSPAVRHFCRTVGNYRFSAGAYVLQRQGTFNAYLPLSITPAPAGTIGMNFTANLPEGTYDVQLTPAHNNASAYVTMQYDAATKGAAGLQIYTFQGGVSADIDGFSICLTYG